MPKISHVMRGQIVRCARRESLHLAINCVWLRISVIREDFQGTWWADAESQPCSRCCVIHIFVIN